MTGEEKIQALIQLINEEYQKLIKGNVIELDSPTLDRIGISLDEQETALRMLSDDYKSIEYVASSVYENEDALSPYDIRDISEIASMSLFSREQVKQSFLELMTYKITVLDNFNITVASLSDGAMITKSRDKNIAEISLNKSSKTVRISYNGVSKNLKTFKSSKKINYLFLSNLLNNPDEPLNRLLLGVSKHSTKVKDLPKTAGFTGELKNIFFDIDSKNQTLALHPKKSLTPEEAETINSFVKEK